MKSLRITLAMAGLLLAGAAAHATSVNDLNWMTGHWVGQYNGLPMEAYYSNSAGGMILGITKVADGDKANFFEFEQLAQVGDSIILKPFPFATKGVEFPLKEISANRAVFENPSHDYPTRIIYELNASGQLHARIEGAQNGKPLSDEFLFTKAQ